jgi:hypothetical protein
MDGICVHFHPKSVRGFDREPVTCHSAGVVESYVAMIDKILRMSSKGSKFREAG